MTDETNALAVTLFTAAAQAQDTTAAMGFDERINEITAPIAAIQLTC